MRTNGRWSARATAAPSEVLPVPGAPPRREGASPAWYVEAWSRRCAGARCPWHWWLPRRASAATFASTDFATARIETSRSPDLRFLERTWCSVMPLETLELLLTDCLPNRRRPVARSLDPAVVER